jgi:N-acetylglucosaminyl-diphospho-decaprenol L-rhamnosyltransferase
MVKRRGETRLRRRVSSPEHDRAPADAVNVTAVVVTHNSGAYLERCLTAVSQSVAEVIVVDNATSDRSHELVHSFPGARLIELGRNAGFGTACNVGMREASGRYLLLVNPDAWPVGAAVSSLVDYADRNPRVGIVGPALVNEDGSPQRSVFGYPGNVFWLTAFAAVPAVVSGIYAGWRHAGDWIRRATRRGREEAVSVGKRTFLSGSALLIRADACEEVGGFDERFFLFSEEADLCFRMHAAGWSVAFYDAAVFVHVGGASSPARQDFRYAELLRSYLLFLAKRQGVRRAQRARRLLVGILVARAALTAGDGRALIRSAAARLRSSDLLSPMA